MQTTNTKLQNIAEPFITLCESFRRKLKDNLTHKQLHAALQIETEVESAVSTTPRNTIKQEQHTSNALGSNILDIKDAVGTTVSIKENKHVQSKILHTANDGLLPTIENYLSKPCIVSSGTLSTNDLPSTFIKYGTTFPMTYNKAFREKLSAVLAIRYTTVVTLQINGTRFQQGLYKLCFLPTGGMIRGAYTESLNRYLRDHLANRSQISQLHSVDFYIGTDTSVQLEIPFMSSFPCATVVHDPSVPIIGDPGVFFIYPYSPLIAVEGSSTASYTLWTHYKDIELLGNTAPTVGPITLQGNFERKQRKKKNIDLLEAETHQNGPISSPLKIVAEASSTLAKIPLLSGYAGPLAWAASALSRTASAFGWSKPPQLDSSMRVKQMYMNYLPNADQKDDATPMSLISTNHIDVLPGFAGTDVDEMSIDYLKSIPGLLRIDPWTSDTAQGSLLMTIPIAPSAFIYQGQGVVAGHVNYTPVAFLASMFYEYTGGFKFHFKFVKTEFHSGRIAIVFNPYESTLCDENYTFTDTPYLSKTIVDLRLTNEVTVEVPYVSVIPWRPTTVGDNKGQVYGSLKIFVIDTLVAPDTVSQNIEILTEVSGADDLRFAVPSPNRLVRPLIAAYQMNTEEDEKLDSISSNYIGSNVNIDTDLYKEEACVGETITSLRQILKRGGIMNTDERTTNVSVAYLRPFAYRLSDYDTPTEYNISRDPYALFSSIYSMQRGGIRIKWMSDTNSGMIYYYYGRQLGIPSATQVYEVTNDDYWKYIANTPNSQFNMEKGYMGGMAAQLPFYHVTHSSPTGANAVAEVSPLSANVSSGANLNTLTTIFSVSLPANKMFFHRSGADDCNFGGFASIPPFVISTIVPPTPP